MKLVLIIAITMALACLTNASFNPPHYSQKDPKWGRNTLGFGSYTIAQQGCFLSVITSMIASQGIEVNGAIPNPGTMNSWFKANDGFKRGLLLYRAAEKFGFTHEGFTTSKSESIKAFNEGKFILLHVEHKSHWVLVTDYDSEGYSVMDPADVRTSYGYNEVNEVAIYSPPKDSSAEPTSDFKFKSTSEPTFELTPEPTLELESASTSTSTSIPHYSQKDSRWGGETLGLGSYTISQQGCFLTCITSMIASEGIKVNGVIPNPSTMNKWFKANGGFKRGLLLYQAAEKLGFTYEGFATSKRDIIKALNAGKFVMLHVENGSHWVVATDYDSNGYSVMDPADVRTSYDYDEVPEVAIYSYE